jgi:single-stranded DNA-specific DHH superfamily exonuclease
MKARDTIKGFLETIDSKDNVVIVFHNDADGICSAVLMKKFLVTKEIEPYLISQPMPVDENLIDKIKLSVPDKIIFLDLAIDQHAEVLKELKSIAKLAIIDHHQIQENMNKKGIIHYNPRFAKADIYQSCGYLVYKILSEIMDMNKYLWLAAIAMTGDYDLKDSEDLVAKVRKNLNVKDLYKSDIGRVVDMISSARATKKISSEEMADIIYNAEDLNDVLDNRKLLESYKIISSEINGVLIDAETNSEKTNNMILYGLKTDYNIKSQVATELSRKYPDKLVVIYQKKGAKIKISARNQTVRFDVCNTLRKAVKGLKAHAGGHENAGGGTVASKDWLEFKDKLKELIG